MNMLSNLMKVFLFIPIQWLYPQPGPKKFVYAEGFWYLTSNNIVRYHSRMLDTHMCVLQFPATVEGY